MMGLIDYLLNLKKSTIPESFKAKKGLTKKEIDV